MIIETKFNPSEEIWFMFDNKPTMRTVLDVDINLSPIPGTRPKITYEVLVNLRTYAMVEQDCFKTKQELISSL